MGHTCILPPTTVTVINSTITFHVRNSSPVYLLYVEAIVMSTQWVCSISPNVNAMSIRTSQYLHTFILFKLYFFYFFGSTLPYFFPADYFEEEILTIVLLRLFLFKFVYCRLLYIELITDSSCFETVSNALINFCKNC